MANVYIGGPVLRNASLPPGWVRATYEIVTGEAKRFDAEVILPESEAWLEAMEPGPFYNEINSRIRASDVGVVLFVVPDASAAIEACLLARFEKPVLVIAPEVASVPRLVRGLPTVARVIAASGPEAVRDAIRDFFEDNLRAHGATASF